MIPMMLNRISAMLGAESAEGASGVVVKGVSTDSRTIRPGDVFFALSGDRFDGHDFVDRAFDHGACACVVHKDYVGAGKGPLLRVEDTIDALGRLAAHHRREHGAKVIAVTGSNGKTTTKAMIAHVLGSRLRGRASIKSFNNNIGVPLTLLSAEPEDAFLVVEIGSNAPGEVAALAAMAQPDIGVVTSVGHAHLEGLGGLEGVRREKLSLLRFVVDGGLAVVNAAALDVENGPATDDSRNRVHLATAGSSESRLRWTTFGDCPGSGIRVSDVCGDLHHTFATIDDRHVLRLSVPGAHNALNAAAAFAVCRHLGMSEEEILDALGTFRMPELRLNVVQAGGLTLIIDCYNANPTSMTAGLDILSRVSEGRRVLVAGPMAELGAESEALHRMVGRRAVSSGADLVVAVGASARGIAEGAAEERGAIMCYDSTATAAEDLPSRLRPGDTVLIKGSRLAGLETLAESIHARWVQRGVTRKAS